MKKGTFITWGRAFQTTVFKTDDDANAFMVKHSAHGLLGIDKTGGRHVAALADKGEPIPFWRYVVLLSDFGHDTNGNATAHHAVWAIRAKDDPITAPAAVLYETKRRQQIGYGDHTGWAGQALQLAGAPAGLKRVAVEGSRSEGKIVVVYDLEQDA